MHLGWLVILSVTNLSPDRGFLPALALLTHLPTGLWRARVLYSRPTVSGAFTQEDAAWGFGVMRDMSVSTNHSPVTWMDFFFSSLETKSCKAAERINWWGTSRLLGLCCSFPQKYISLLFFFSTLQNKYKWINYCDSWKVILHICTLFLHFITQNNACRLFIVRSKKKNTKDCISFFQVVVEMIVRHFRGQKVMSTQWPSGT